MNVLFLCTGNSCRSILGEATFNHLAPAGWHAMSAGSQPAGYVHPRSLALLAREGIATDGYYSKSWDKLPATPGHRDHRLRQRRRRDLPGLSRAGAAHATGASKIRRTPPARDEEIDAAFMQAYRILRTRIEAFLALPLEELQHDRARLKAELDRIGALLP